MFLILTSVIYKGMCFFSFVDILEKFFRIRAWYAAHDETVRKREGKSYFRTEHGLWGAAGMLDVFELCMKAKIEQYGTFADYGSGDGRIVLIAALFGDAVGIEGSAELTNLAEQAKAELVKDIPELKRATFKTGDYYEEKHNDYGVLFFFADHPFPAEFQKTLRRTWEGILLVYGQIHVPELLVKGKSYWSQQVPIITYWVNKEESLLFKNDLNIDEEIQKLRADTNKSLLKSSEQ